MAEWPDLRQTGMGWITTWSAIFLTFFFFILPLVSHFEFSIVRVSYMTFDLTGVPRTVHYIVPKQLMAYQKHKMLSQGVRKLIITIETSDVKEIVKAHTSGK